jgi:hypothetical protein
VLLPASAVCRTPHLVSRKPVGGSQCVPVQGGRRGGGGGLISIAAGVGGRDKKKKRRK